MLAKFVKATHNSRIITPGKVQTACFIAHAVINGELVDLAEARCYMGKSRNSSTVYAVFWTNDSMETFSGYGSAGGAGYHKESAAIGAAIESAGIELYKDALDQYGRATEPQEIGTRAYIDGCGEYAIKEAMTAIGRTVLARRDITDETCVYICAR